MFDMFHCIIKFFFIADMVLAKKHTKEEEKGQDD